MLEDLVFCYYLRETTNILWLLRMRLKVAQSCLFRPTQVWMEPKLKRSLRTTKS